MKMPGKIDPVLFAPCGMNCQVCYKHLSPKKACTGCLIKDNKKPGHCRHCAIKDCVQKAALTYCYECPQFPCKQVKNLDRSYRTRYRCGLIHNGCTVKEKGLSAFMKEQAVTFRCPVCGGVISLHDSRCSECNTIFKK